MWNLFMEFINYFLDINSYSGSRKYQMNTSAINNEPIAQ